MYSSVTPYLTSHWFKSIWKVKFCKPIEEPSSKVSFSRQLHLRWIQPKKLSSKSELKEYKPQVIMARVW